MTPADLQAILAPVDGRLSVDGTALSSDRITELFTTYLPGATLTLQNATTRSATVATDTGPLDAVQVTGTPTGDVLGLAGLSVDARFFLLDGTAHCLVTLTGLPDPWTPAASFPAVAGSALAGAALHGCSLTLDSRPRPALGGTVDVPVQYDVQRSDPPLVPAPLLTTPPPRGGLSVTGQLDLSSIDATLAGVVPTGTLAVGGDVELVGQWPRMLLRTTDPVVSFTFQGLQLTVGYELATAPVQPPGAPVQQRVRERLTTTLTYPGDQAGLTVPLAVTFEPDSLADGLIIASDPDHSSPVTLPTLEALIPGQVGQLIPPTFPALDQLTLTDLAVQVGGSPLALQAAHARVALPGTWTVVPSLAVLGDLRIDLTVASEGGQWRLRPLVMAGLDLAGGRLTGVFDLSAKSWFCMLDDDSVLDLRALFEQTLQLRGLLPDQVQVEVTQFEIRGDYAASIYGLDVGTTVTWPLQVGATTLALESLAVSLEYEADGSLTGNLGGTLAIGPVTGSVRALYDPTGLTFEVSAYHLPLTQLLADVVGDPRLTDHLPDVEFAVLSVTVTPSTGAFALSANGRIAWQLPFGGGLALNDLAVTLTRAAAPTGTIPQADQTAGNQTAGNQTAGNQTASRIGGSLRGTLTLGANEPPYDLTVASDLTSGGGGLRFEGSTGPGQQIPIGRLIADLAARFGDVTLPAALAGLVVTNLHVAFDTQAKSFSCSAESVFPLDGGGQVDVTVTIDLTQKDSVYNTTFGGRVTVGPLAFDLHVSRTPAVVFCVGTYRHAAPAAPLGGGPSLAGAGTLNVKDLVGHLSSEVAALVPDDLQIDLKDVVLALGRTDTGTRALIGLDVGARLTLSGLPLVGQQFAADQTAGIDDLRLLVATADLRRSDVTTINGLLPPDISPLPLPAAAGTTGTAGSGSGGSGGASEGPPPAAASDDVVLGSGPTVSALLSLGTTSQALTLPVTATGSGSGATRAPVAAPAAADSTRWFILQRTFGPLHLARVGVQYRDSVLWFLLDAALSAMGLTLSLDGLGLGSPITRFDPRFTLRGLGIDYRTEAVEIGAAFLHTTVTDAQGRTYDEYDGAAVLKAKVLTVSAIGSYAYLDGHPSLFIYAVLDYPIGGPAFFFVTGLAAGFGYNRDLVVPPIDQVATFPLVSDATRGAGAPAPTPPPPGNDVVAAPAPTPAPNPAEQVMAELERLRAYVPPAIGQNFLAAGIAFNSFKMVDSFALLTVSFGQRVEVNVLGLSTMVVPTPIPGEPAVTPLAEIQLAIKASFVPDLGFLGVAAQLTPASYVLSRDCHLTGGFAFWCWFPTPGGSPAPHAGDFVLTLGGYHPDFPVPAHYPQVPRLGVNWKVSAPLTIKGEAYFALTPAAVMAGVLMDATWDSGDLKAWFHAGADFIVGWKPYHYDGRAYAALRVSYRFEFFGTHEIRVDASADLHVWGPEFSGRAAISVSVVQFEITFGADAPAYPTPLDWTQFTASFLPQPVAGGAIPCCSLAVADGLMRTLQGADAAEVPALGVVNPKRFVLVAGSVVPSTAAVAGQVVDLAPLALSPVGVAPMDIAAGRLATTLTVTITRDGAAAEAHFGFTPIVKPMPAALWGGSLAPALGGDRFVDRALAGFEIRPLNDVESVTGQTLHRDGWQYTDAPTVPTYRWEPAQVPQLSGPAATADVVRATLTAPDTVAARQRLLSGLGVEAPIDVDPSIADQYATA